MWQKILTLVLSLLFTAVCMAEDTRIKVDMPPMMQEHMMHNMRDHLLALQTITHQLATQQFDAAADTAETRLGMSSLGLHGAEHMAIFMPNEMSDIGTGMHHAASRFAIAARDAAVEGGLEKAFAALSDVMQQCVACHDNYKIH